ncbi:hypothetical protein BGW80DRAFT_1332765 [Lactifluus volemus]|nr:hypothetical protein BGW80DRAFT_1332765 [Lactifluus volemus]
MQISGLARWLGEGRVKRECRQSVGMRACLRVGSGRNGHGSGVSGTLCYPVE